jgi:hypothetical protein
LETFGHEMISEEELIRRLKIWYECLSKAEERFQVAYFSGFPIYGFLIGWLNGLQDVNRDREPCPSKLAYRVALSNDKTGELRAEALHNFRAHVEHSANRNLFRYHNWEGRKNLSYLSKRMREEIEKQSLYKWPLNSFSVSNSLFSQEMNGSDLRSEVHVEDIVFFVFNNNDFNKS